MIGRGAKYAATLAGVALLAVAASGAALAQSEAAAGRFIAVTGEVKIVGADGVAREAERGGELRQGESIVTGTNALAQVRMTDGGALSVRAETQIKLEGYRFQGQDDPEPSFFASLIKGGFRTITGLIGRGRRDSYKVATTSATMGIRGTHFEIVHIVQPLPGAAPGTYNRVYDGTVAIQNRAGAELLVTRDQTVFVALPGNLAPVLVRPPAGIYSKPTPVPVFKPQARDESDAAAHKDRAAHKDKSVAPRVREALGDKDSPAILAPRTAQPVEAAPSLSPIVAPKTTISPTLSSPLLTPIDTPTTTISPTLISPTTTTISPTTTTISPTTTTISPTTTTISPTTTTISPTTTTISPTLISPTTTTISPTTTTISPTLISPTTTTISPTTTTISPTTTTISPTLTSPTTTTISPTLTAPTTTTIRK